MIVSEINDNPLDNLCSINGGCATIKQRISDDGVEESTVWRKRKAKTILPNGHETNILMAIDIN